MSIISNSKTRAQILQEELIELLKRDLISMEDYKRILTAHQEYAKQIDKSMDALQHNEPQMQREKEILSEEVPHAAEQNQPEGTAKTVPKPDNAYGKRILTSFLEGNKKEWLSAPEQQEKSVQKKRKTGAETENCGTDSGKKYYMAAYSRSFISFNQWSCRSNQYLGSNGSFIKGYHVAWRLCFLFSIKRFIIPFS